MYLFLFVVGHSKESTRLVRNISPPVVIVQPPYLGLAFMCPSAVLQIQERGESMEGGVWAHVHGKHGRLVCGQDCRPWEI